MRITFYGAAGEVTGSKHLVELGGQRILLDGGLFQGRREESRQKNSRLAFNPRTIDAVIISHAHLDHVGQLPLLVKNGFDGPIYSTGATRDLAGLILLDAAHIQEQDADYALRHGLLEASITKPLYRTEDIPVVMERWQTIHYQRLQPGWFKLGGGVKLKLFDAGHILGSAITVLNAGDETLVYTGDLGHPNRPLLNDPEYPSEPAQTLIIESTYGLRQHRHWEEVEKDLADIINGVIQRKGKIVVPAFSLGRTQELIYRLHQMTDRNIIPRLPIIVDSPLAQRVTGAYAKHQQDYDLESSKDFSRPRENPLEFSNLEFTHSVEESKAINARPGPMIIISSSGMLSGGRVLHHLKNLLPSTNNLILFTGYQADHTPGRRLIKGAPTLQIHGQQVPVRAQIKVLNDLSAHADAVQLVGYAEHINGLKDVFLVHGEDDRRLNLKEMMMNKHRDWQIELPVICQSFSV